MYCLDTYALVEIHDGNKNYLKFLGEEFVIPYPSLAEFYYVMIKRFNEKTANFWIEKLKLHSKPVSLSIWLEAVKFKHDHKKENLSFFDCVGYMFSLKSGYSFVTGDKAFVHKKGVKFIK
ncbi:MAG: PIN domain-containing protein [Candidatus Micrarchaeota archaeon]